MVPAAEIEPAEAARANRRSAPRTRPACARTRRRPARTAYGSAGPTGRRDPPRRSPRGRAARSWFSASMKGSGSNCSMLKTPFAAPLAGQHHLGADHGGHAGGVRDGLRLHLAVARLVVADVVDIVTVVRGLPSFTPGDDAADAGLALVAGRAGGIRQQRLEELQRHNFLPLEIHRVDAGHAHVHQQRRWSGSSRQRSSRNACGGRSGNAGQRLQLLVVQQVHVLEADLVKSNSRLMASGSVSIQRPSSQ
jgi:hypothetical protein